MCARGADPAWSSGPSTSPLDGMLNATAFRMRCTLLLATFLLWCQVEAFAQAATPEHLDVSMILENANGPFVTIDFAKRLGRLVMEQKYPGVTFDSQSPTVLDKGDVWWVTFTVKEWPQNMAKLRPALADHLTLWIRKRDAAILGIH